MLEGCKDHHVLMSMIEPILVDKDVHEHRLRKVGWVPESKSKRSGEGRYDPVRDAKNLRYWQSKRMEDDAAGVARAKDPNERIAMILAKRVLEYAPLPTLRTVARALSEEGLVSYNDFCNELAELYPEADLTVLHDKRLCHPLTHQDSKTGVYVVAAVVACPALHRHLPFFACSSTSCHPAQVQSCASPSHGAGNIFRGVESIVKANPDRGEHLWRSLAFGHLAYLLDSSSYDKIDINVFTSGDVPDMVAHVRDLHGMVNARTAATCSGRHQPGVYLVSRGADEKRNGKGKSLGGRLGAGAEEQDTYLDVDGNRVALFHALCEGKAELSDCTTGKEILAMFKRTYAKGVEEPPGAPVYPGAGELMSQRTLTLMEPTGLFREVIGTYMAGGSGSQRPSAMVAAELGIEDYDSEVVMERLRSILSERQGSADETPLQRAVVAVARQLKTTLAPIASECGLLAATTVTGGTIETMHCDGLYRGWRLVFALAATPHLSPWCVESSGGPAKMDVYPLWRDGSDVPELYNMGSYLEDTLREAQKKKGKGKHIALGRYRVNPIAGAAPQKGRKRAATVPTLSSSTGSKKGKTQPPPPSAPSSLAPTPTKTPSPSNRHVPLRHDGALPRGKPSKRHQSNGAVRSPLPKQAKLSAAPSALERLRWLRDRRSFITTELGLPCPFTDRGLPDPDFAVGSSWSPPDWLVELRERFSLKARIDNHFASTGSNAAHKALRRWLGLIGFGGGEHTGEPLLTATNLQAGPTCGAVSSWAHATVDAAAAKGADWMVASTESAVGPAALSFAYGTFMVPARPRLDGTGATQPSYKLNRGELMTGSEVHALYRATYKKLLRCTDDVAERESGRHECVAFDEACDDLLTFLIEAHGSGVGTEGLHHRTVNSRCSTSHGDHWFGLTYSVEPLG